MFIFKYKSYLIGNNYSKYYLVYFNVSEYCLHKYILNLNF